jgi:cell division septation protein DedD
MTEDPSKGKTPTPTPTTAPTPTTTPRPTPATTPTPAAAAPPKPAANDAGWFVQLNAFSTKGAADNFIKELKAKGYTASAVSTATLFKVRMGPYADRAEADKVAGRLVKDGYKPLVTR